MGIKLIIGLGNPGPDYELTRHNAGAWFVHALAVDFCDTPFKNDKKLQGYLTSLFAEFNNCKLFLPSTFMNNSGSAVVKIMQFFRITLTEILVVHDDLDLIPGRIKFKIGGGHGGHNGLRDIITKLGNADFARLRLGIGHPQQKKLVTNYVLSKPDMHDKSLIDDAIIRGVYLIPQLLRGSDITQINNLLAGG